MKFFKNISDLAKDISSINKEFVSDVKNIAAETKRDVIQVWKVEAPILGNTADKVDRAVTTIKNAAEHLPDPMPHPENPELAQRKLIKKFINVNTVVDKNETNIGRAHHLKVKRIGYSHHALSLNNHEVIHYQDGIVKVDSIKDFAKEGAILIVNTARLYKKDEVINRAYSKLNESRYNLLFNNCEHFVRWALNGEK